MKPTIMKKFTGIIALLLFCGFSSAQNFAVGHLQRSFSDSGRAGRSVPCEIYYPATQAGENTSPAEGVFPVLAFGHGFVMPWSVYEPYWQNLVPQGFILVFPITETSFSPSHLDFGRDLAFACRAMKAEGASQGSVFAGKISDRSAVMGHSMGGGSAFLAAQEDSSISALAVLAPANTNPSAIQAAAGVNRPALVFSGANDCVTPPAAHQLPMYGSLASACKTYLSITGGNHCQFAAFNLNCSFGQSTCSPQATINSATQQSLVFTHLVPWLRFYLKDDCESADGFQSLIAGASAISVQQNCTLNCNTTEAGSGSKSVHSGIFPNPAADRIWIRLPDQENYAYRIFDLRGNCLQDGIAEAGAGIAINGLKPGSYIVQTGKLRRLFVKAD